MRVEDLRIDRPIGRERAIRSIIEEMDRRGACYVSGSAGIGKSMVLREVRRRLVGGTATLRVSPAPIAWSTRGNEG